MNDIGNPKNLFLFLRVSVVKKSEHRFVFVCCRWSLRLRYSFIGRGCDRIAVYKNHEFKFKSHNSNSKKASCQFSRWFLCETWKEERTIDSFLFQRTIDPFLSHGGHEIKITNTYVYRRYARRVLIIAQYGTLFLV